MVATRIFSTVFSLTNTIIAKKIPSYFESFNIFGIVEYNIWLMILETIRLKTPQDQPQFTHGPTLS